MLLKKLNIVAVLVDHRRKKREEERERKRAFLENGGLVLEKLVASCNGRPIPIRTFSYQQLILATNDFDHRLILHEDSGFQMYKGSFEGRILSIKSYNKKMSSAKDWALMDIAISAKMSSHKNVLKLVGCCLETSIPTIVYEYAQNGVLANRICTSERQGTPMVWQSRLKIIRQIAHAPAYLNTAFSRPIIHTNITSRNIFLDQHDVPKLADFSLCISIPEGEIHVVTDHVIGTLGFVCPNYLHTNTVTEKTDVYSFGMVLLQILIGHDCYVLHAIVSKNIDMLRNNPLEDHEKLIDSLRNRALNEIVDPAILEEGGASLEPQLQAVLELGLTCTEHDPEIRPTMVDVTKELRRIERIVY